MNSESNNNVKAGLIYFGAILGAMLIVVFLVEAMRHYTTPPALNANRVAERAKARAEAIAADAQALSTTGWKDQKNGIVRLRVEDAVRIVERDWGRDPMAARSNLLMRVDKANPPPPPPPPPPTSPLE